ncbi:helix-turn-helix domain-containing protein [Clostridium botulinum]|nr:helix-turn-helix domain-containing protein [Clostridium botulinum]NFP29653.1 helix-turn-helix domain-containing protein [Clostridium botulinum]
MNEEKRMEDIINRIKNRRNKLMLSYQDLANKTGLSKSTLQRYETGSIKNIPLDKLEILANALNVTPMWIIGYDMVESTNSLDNSNPINLSKEETTLLENYNKLNNLGKKEANKRVAELTEINKYIDTKENNVINLSTTEERGEYNLAAHDDNLDSETAKRNLNKAKEIFKQMDEE